jgi:tight adherence protein B
VKVGAALAVCLAAVAATTAVAASAAAPTAPRLVEAGEAVFPYRAFVLSLPAGVRPQPGTVRVTENGVPVHGLSLTPAGTAQEHDTAVVLAVDASNSMRGEPISAAFAAARAFASHRNPAQELATLTFDGQVHVRRPFTTDDALIAKTLSRQATLGEGTRIYDALERSARLLAASGASSRSVVLLSDGADVGSVAKAQDVVRMLKDEHVRVFAVGLVSKAFDQSALTNLATATGGSFTAARSPADLEPIFDQLGFALSREYIVRYRSTAAPAKHVNVAVKVKGVPTAAVAGYMSPTLQLPTAPTYHRTVADRVIQSPVTMILVALLGAGLLAAGVMAAVRPRSGSVRQRIGAFVSMSIRPARPTVEATANAAFLARTERSLAQLRRWEQFRRTLQIADITTPPLQIVVLTFLCTLLTMFMFTLLLGGVGVIVGLGAPLVAYFLIRAKLDRKRRTFSEQLPDNLEVLASALRAGHSLIGALSVVVENAPEPSKSEFSRVVADEQLGAPLEDALGIVVERMANRDLDQVALVARLQRETGSNSAEVLDRVVENVRARLELRRLVRTLTAQGRMSRWVLTFIPVALGLILTLINPGYLDPLFEHGSGRAMLIFAGVMITAGSLVIRKIVNIKV